MNATWMLALYPRHWRERYGDEFRETLSHRSATITDMVDIGFGALDAHLRPTPEPTRPITPTRPTLGPNHPSDRWMELFLGHLGISVSIMALVALINWLIEREVTWALYPIWGLGLLLITHLGLTWPWRGLLGAHALVTAWGSVGLIGINLATGSPAWSVFPVIALGGILIVHALASFLHWNAIQVHLGLIGVAIALSVAMLLFGTGLSATLWSLVYAGISLVPHWLVKARGVSLLGAHVATFVLFNATFILNSLLDDEFWAIYPLVAWGILFAAHWLVFSRLLGASGDWHTNWVERIAPTGGKSRWQVLVQSRRGLIFHILLFGLGVIEFGVLNLMDRDHGWWMLYPVGVWLILLAGHIGAILLPNHWFFGILLGSGLVTAIGLVFINRETNDYPWAVYPIGGWLIVLALIFGFSSSGTAPLFRAHVLATVAAVVCCLGLYVVGVGDPWAIWPIWGFLIALALHAGMRLTPASPWVGLWWIGGGVVVLGLVAIDYVYSGGIWWWWAAGAWLVFGLTLSALNIDLAALVDESNQRARRPSSRQS